MKLRLPRKIKYLRKARHWHGHGIHSPFLFYLVTEIIEDKKQFAAYRVLRVEKKRILSRLKELDNPGEITYKGIPLHKLAGKRQLFKHIELGYRYGKLLLRLINEFKPSSVSFYGPTLGMNLLYLALPDHHSVVYTPPADPQALQLYNELFENPALNKIHFQPDDHLTSAEQDFVFINLPFLPEETRNILQQRLKFPGEDGVIIIRGIHRSEVMESIWQEMVKNKKVRVSLDLYEIGILLFRKKLQKQHFVLRF